jgi:hypothetical protein
VRSGFPHVSVTCVTHRPSAVRRVTMRAVRSPLWASRPGLAVRQRQDGEAQALPVQGAAQARKSFGSAGT